jgi:hypothetical protein
MRKTTRKFATQAAAVLIVTAMLAVDPAFGYPNGVSGYTQKSGSTGCSCHGSATTSLVYSFVGPASLTTGQTASYRFSSSSMRGFDVAVSSGTLAKDSTANVQLTNSELTHTNNTTVSYYEFKYTAPLTPGTVTLYGTGVKSFSSGWNFAPNLTITVSSPTSVDDHTLVPSHIVLDQNYPNPFNPTTVISYQLSTVSKVHLRVFDMTGREVARLAEGVQTAGTYRAQLNASALSSGTYLYRLEAIPVDGSGIAAVATKKLVVLK